MVTSFLFYAEHCDFAGIRTQDPYIKSVLLYQLSYEIKPYFCVPVRFTLKGGANVATTL